MDLSRWYHPITATPFQNDSHYHELPPRHALLRPWIRCLWGGRAGSSPAPHPVIPDTCSDIILRIDKRSGTVRSDYCAISDETFFSSSAQDPLVELFAVRFYAWAAPAFMQDSLHGRLNGFLDAREHFPALVRDLLQMLTQTDTFPQRCERTEQLLLKHLNASAIRPELLNATADILQSCGSIRISALAQHCQLSTRQLERLFDEYTGASPKKLSDLIRYQCLWREAAFSPAFDVQDAVFRYGYADQSHLLRQFRRYHGMTLSEAVSFARVGFVQYNQDSR